MKDNIFGDLIDPKQRLKQHLQDIEGVHHRYRHKPLDPNPDQPIEIFVTTSGPIPYDAVRCSYTTNGCDPIDGSNSFELVSTSSNWDTLSWGIVRVWSGTIPPQPGDTLVRYKLAAHRVDTNQWVEADNSTCFALYVDREPVPDWSRDAIIYQILPDRFFPGNNRRWNVTNSLTDIFGGTLRGIIDKLDYIKDLGFNTIWLNPFFPSTSHHGYNASDYFTVEPRLGTNEEMDELIGKAHDYGMRLLLDFVANHWSKEHFTFQDALQHLSSPYHDWYTWNDWPKDYECYFHVRELPKINLHNPDARAYMINAARFWLSKGFDGYRLDFAYGPPHDFWLDFRRSCREINPECWIFGEVIHDAEWVRSYTGFMDGTLDFFLARALRQTFAQEEMTLAEFEAFIAGHENYFPNEHIRPSFLDNHDESRFLYLSGNDKAILKLAALVQYTLSGPPIVFAGTETGLSQERSMYQNGRNIFEECRLPMNWETPDTDLQDYYRKLNVLRLQHPVLKNGIRKVIHLNSDEGLYVYERLDSMSKIIVAINKSREMRKITIGNPGFESACDQLNGNRIDNRGSTIDIYLPPKSAAFIC